MDIHAAPSPIPPRVAPNWREPHLDEQEHLIEDVPCRQCGYNLHGLHIAAHCPECGLAVGRSIMGDLLQFSEPAWVRTLASGMNWLVVAVLLMIGLAMVGGVWGAVATVQSTAPPQWALALLGVVPSLVTVVAYWKLTVPDPAEATPEHGINARTLARYGLVLATLLGIPQNFSPAAQQTAIAVGVLTIFSALLGLVGYFALFVYMRRLALRIPDAALASQTRVVMWGMAAVYALIVVVAVAAVVSFGLVRVSAGAPSPSFTPMQGLILVLCCVLGLGSLVFGIWSLVLIFWYRRRFMAVAQQADATWGATT